MLDLWRALGRPERGRLLIALLLGAGAAALSVTLLALSGWFIAASALAGLGGAAWSFNHLYPSAGIRAAAVGRVAGRYAEQIVGHAATLHLSAHLRPKLFRALALSRPGVAPLPATSQAQLIEEVDTAEAGFLRLWVPSIGVAAGVALTGGLAAAVDGLGTLLAAGAIGLITWDLCRRTRGVGQAAIELATLEAAQRQAAGEMIDGARALECLNALPTATAALLAESSAAWDRREEIETRARRWGVLPTAAAGLFAALALFRAHAVGSDLPMALAVALAGVASLHAAGGLALLAPLWPKSTRAAAELATVLKAPSTPLEPTQSAVLTTCLPLEVKGLMLQPGGPDTRCGPIDFTLAAGELLMVTGPSGVGKTSLLETLLRLRAPVAGEIVYGGIGLADLRGAAVRRTVALAPQTPQFGASSLAEALRLADPAIAGEAFWEALELAGLNPLIARLPEGLATPLAEGGTGLSGGELRRVGIARALLAQPALLLLDEPFAGLDYATAAQVTAGLANWVRAKPARAVLIVSHTPLAVGWPGPVKILRLDRQNPSRA